MSHLLIRKTYLLELTRNRVCEQQGGKEKECTMLLSVSLSVSVRFAREREMFSCVAVQLQHVETRLPVLVLWLDRLDDGDEPLDEYAPSDRLSTVPQLRKGE